MCQILPFTLPCCRRTYVEISKLPSCPDAWPEHKCPPELCIQVRYDAEDRGKGICWRCQADISGLLGEARENLRPDIDSAMIVHGLDEVGVSGRRKIAEEGGVCWYCGAKAGCQYCTPIKHEVGTEQEKPEDLGKKRQREGGRAKDKAINKRIKVEPRDHNQPQSPTFSRLHHQHSSHSPHLQYPQHPQQWENRFSAPSTNVPFHPAYGFAQGSSIASSNIPWDQQFPQALDSGMASVDWAATRNDNSSQIGLERKWNQVYTGANSTHGHRGEPPSDFPASQFQYPDPDPDSASDVKSVVGPDVNFGYVSQTDEAAQAYFLQPCSNQYPNVSQEHSQQQTHKAYQQDDGREKCTTNNSSLPPDSINTSPTGVSAC